MYQKRLTQVLCLIFLILLPACNLPVNITTNQLSSNPAAATAAFQTEVARIVASTQTTGLVPPQSAAETPTITPTFTPSFTPTLSLTTTSSIPLVSVSTETFCRTGPGEPYDLLTTLKVGVSAEIVGRSPDGGSWIIRNPDNPATNCWLWAHYATVVGDTSHLPMFPFPPTPTPQPSFTYSFHGYGNSAGFQCFMFDVTNTGGSKWDSYRLTIQDITQGVSGTDTHDAFIAYDSWCLELETRIDLTPAEVGTATVTMVLPVNPTGDHFETSLTVCSQNGLAGTCLTKSIDFDL